MSLCTCPQKRGVIWPSRGRWTTSMESKAIHLLLYSWGIVHYSQFPAVDRRYINPIWSDIRPHEVICQRSDIISERVKFSNKLAALLNQEFPGFHKVFSSLNALAVLTGLAQIVLQFWAVMRLRIYLRSTCFLPDQFTRNYKTEVCWQQIKAGYTQKEQV